MPTGDFPQGTYIIPNSYRSIGICSICGGEVVQYFGVWYGIYPPVPLCSRCGAVRQITLPIIPMVPKVIPKEFVLTPEMIEKLKKLVEGK